MGLRWTQIGNDPQGVLFDDESLVGRHVGTGEFRGLEFLHVDARRVVNEIPKAARLPFRHTINTYRGCSHACTYCFARPTHAYLDLGTGDDFDRKIVVKVNAVERARAELDPRRRVVESVALGTNTDPYQRCEGKYHLTQRLIDVFAETRTPFSILTKSTLILRDLDRLVAVAERVPVRCDLSIGAGYLHLRPGVREHFFDRLGAHRPDLVTTYQARYGGGRAYLPSADEKLLTARVGRFVEDARGRLGGHRGRVRNLARAGLAPAGVAAEIAAARPGAAANASAFQLGLPY